MSKFKSKKMDKLGLFRRGIGMVEDALFVKDKFIPTAISDQRWNIVCYEAYRVTELLIKGMINLSGLWYLEIHELNKILDWYTEKLSEELGALPVFYRVITPNKFYIISDFDNIQKTIQILLYASGIFTELGSGDIDDLPNEALSEVVLKHSDNTWKMFKGNTEIMSTTSAANVVHDPGNICISLYKMLDPERITVIKQSVIKLRDKRERAFYSEKIYSKEDASNSITLMDETLALSTEFIEVLNP